MRLKLVAILLSTLLLAAGPVWSDFDYTKYNGKWTDLSMINDRMTNDSQKTLDLKISPEGTVTGELEYLQIKPVNGGFKATAQLSGKIENGRALCQFRDDWGYTGFVEIEFFRHQLRAGIKMVNVPREPAPWRGGSENIYFTRMSHQPLLNHNEAVVFSFRIPETDQILTIGIGMHQSDYLVCRLGKMEYFEVEYPPDLHNSWKKYTFSGLSRREQWTDTLELAYLMFKHQGLLFTVYQEYQAGNNQESVGVKMTDLNNGETLELTGDSATIIGSLTTLRRYQKLRRLD
ncbi:MAG TPA: hypothetical protein VIM29_09095 [Bacillota bacterium]